MEVHPLDLWTFLHSCSEGADRPGNAIAFPNRRLEGT